MSHTEKTPNYSLPLFADDDTPTWLGDWNQGMGEIDSALNAMNANVADSGTKIANLTVRVENVEGRIEPVKTAAENALSLAKTNEQDIALAETRITANEKAVEGLTATAGEALGAANEAKAEATSLRGEMDGKAPVSHASGAKTYGGASASSYGHVKVTDVVDGTGARDSVAVSSIAVRNAVTAKVANKTAVLIGDSYLTGATDRIGNALQGTYPDWKWMNYADSGSGFTFGGSQGRTFEAQVRNAANLVQSEHSVKPADVGYVMFIGGRNEAGAQDSGTRPEYQTLFNAATRAFSAAKTLFPNASVVCVPCLYDWKLPNKNLLAAESCIRDAAAQSGVWCAFNAWSLGIGEMNEKYVGGNDIHPNSTGSAYMAKALYKAVMTGNPDMMRTRYTPVDTTNFTFDGCGISVSGAVTLGESGNFMSRAAMPNWFKPGLKTTDDWYQDGSTFNTEYGLVSFPAFDETKGTAMFIYANENGLNTKGADPSEVVRYQALMHYALA